MSDLHSCPHCGRNAKKALTSNHFPVHTCRNCSKKYCYECSDGDGTVCPKCESKDYTDYEKV